MRRYVFPLLLGIVGCAILVSLGSWQLRRLEWKEAILADIEARIGGEPVAIPASPDPEGDRYLPVIATGRLPDEELHVLTSVAELGAGYRDIAAFETGGRRILADLGFVPLEDKDAPRGGEVTITGNLHWPQEADGYTPDPDEDRNIWFARDVPRMAAALGTEPILLVARRIEGADLGVTPLPIGTDGIPNDHLNYAITWFGLAAVWAAMTFFLLKRLASRGRED